MNVVGVIIVVSVIVECDFSDDVCIFLLTDGRYSSRQPRQGEEDLCTEMCPVPHSRSWGQT